MNKGSRIGLFIRIRLAFNVIKNMISNLKMRGKHLIEFKKIFEILKFIKRNKGTISENIDMHALKSSRTIAKFNSNYVNKILRSLRDFHLIESSKNRPAYHSIDNRHIVAINNLKGFLTQEEYIEIVSSLYATHCPKDLQQYISEKEKLKAQNILNTFITLSNSNISSFNNKFEILRKFNEQDGSYSKLNKAYNFYTPKINKVFLFSLIDGSISLRFRLLNVVTHNDEVFLLGEKKSELELININQIKSIDRISDYDVSEKDDDLKVMNYIDDNNANIDIETKINIIAPLSVLTKFYDIDSAANFYSLKVNHATNVQNTMFNVSIKGPYDLLISFIKLNLDKIRIVDGDTNILDEVENFYLKIGTNINNPPLFPNLNNNNNWRN
jgi:hypothetical protein